MLYLLLLLIGVEGYGAVQSLLPLGIEQLGKKKSRTILKYFAYCESIKYKYKGLPVPQGTLKVFPSLFKIPALDSEEKGLPICARLRKELARKMERYFAVEWSRMRLSDDDNVYIGFANDYMGEEVLLIEGSGPFSKIQIAPYKNKILKYSPDKFLRKVRALCRYLRNRDDLFSKATLAVLLCEDAAIRSDNFRNFHVCQKAGAPKYRYGDFKRVFDN